MKLNRFIESVAAGLLVLGSGGIASARYLQPEPFLQDDSDAGADSAQVRVPFRLTEQFSGRTPSSGGLHQNWHRIHDSTIGRYLQPDPVMRRDQVMVPRPGRVEQIYAYANSAPLSKIDPFGLYTMAPGANCPNMAAAAAEAQKRLGPATGAANKNCTDKCNKCRDRFCGCDVDSYLTPGTPPTVDFLSGWGRQGKTNCGTFPIGGGGAPNTVYLDQDYCTNPADVPALASLLLHELNHWCNCDITGGPPGRLWAYPGQNEKEPNFEEGDYTEKVCR